MSSSIRIAQKIDALVVVNNSVLPNSYDISFTVSMHTDKPYEQNVVAERLRYFADNIMTGAILVAQDNEILETLMGALDNRFVLFETTPYDAPVCNIFYLKAQAILEEHATIESMSLCSQLGMNVEYFADSDDDYSSLATCSWLDKNQQPWWLRTDLTTDDLGTDTETWTNVGLGWREIKEDSEPTIIEFPKFSPRIVQGEVDVP